MLYKVVLPLYSVYETLMCDYSNKSYCSSFMPCKVDLTFESVSVDETLECEHLLSEGYNYFCAIYYTAKGDSNV